MNTYKEIKSLKKELFLQSGDEKKRKSAIAAAITHMFSAEDRIWTLMLRKPVTRSR